MSILKSVPHGEDTECGFKGECSEFLVELCLQKKKKKKKIP